MAKRNEDECAFCAEKAELEKSIIGEDWKVYCSPSCAEAGENVSRDEMQRLMSIAVANRKQSGSHKVL